MMMRTLWSTKAQHKCASTNAFTPFYQLRNRMWHPSINYFSTAIFHTYFLEEYSILFFTNITIQNINKLWKTRIRCHIKSLKWRWFVSFSVAFELCTIGCSCFFCHTQIHDIVHGNVNRFNNMLKWGKNWCDLLCVTETMFYYTALHGYYGEHLAWR